MASMGLWFCPISNPVLLSHTLIVESYMRWMVSGTPTGHHVNRHYWKRRG